MGIQEFPTLNKNELFTTSIQNKARRHLKIKKKTLIKPFKIFE